MAKVTITIEDDYENELLLTDFKSDPEIDVEEGQENIDMSKLSPAQVYGVLARLFLETEYRRAQEADAENTEEENSKQMELPLEDGNA